MKKSLKMLAFGLLSIILTACSPSPDTEITELARNMELVIKAESLAKYIMRNKASTPADAVTTSMQFSLHLKLELKKLDHAISAYEETIKKGNLGTDDIIEMEGKLTALVFDKFQEIYLIAKPFYEKYAGLQKHGPPV
ncbi:MAG: hypothetical protein ACI9TY_001216 [Alphaproteobacteria bacterium]|jgi:hypothetical protein